jgi:D-alanyl-lipoteichoic acid acyltransferase DltB (MBOAT superfamily)
MIFSDPAFLVFIFLPFAAFAIIDRGLAVPLPLRMAIVVGLSLVYYWHGPAASPLLLGLFVFGNFLLLRIVGGSTWLLLSIALLNIVALFYIKAALPHGAPLGISFHAFQIVGLLVARAQNAFRSIPAAVYFLLLTFFPQLAAGPVVRWSQAHRFFEHWVNREHRPIRLDWVLLFLAIGLAKKTLLADPLYPVVHQLQQASAPFSGVDALVFPFLYSVYLYADFSAYSDIATGIALMIGMRMPINFFSPYKAKSPQIFWRRWHRTLYKFLSIDLRDLYRRFRLPGGTAFVLFAFIFSGYWHGAAWGYMIWAVAHALYFLFFPRSLASRLPATIQTALNFTVVSLFWLPFALGGAGVIRWAHGLAGCLGADWHACTGVSFLQPPDFIILGIGLLLALLAPNAFQLARNGSWWPLKRAAAIILIAIALYNIFVLKAATAPFVYFQF